MTDSIRFELTENEAVDFVVRSVQRSPSRLRTLRMMQLLGLMVVTGGCVVFALAVGEWWVVPVGVVLGVGGMFVGVPWTLRRRMPEAIRQALRSAQGRALGGVETVRLADDGLERVLAESESKIAWTAVERLEADATTLAFFFAPSAAYVVPRRAFQTPDDEKSFRERAEKLSRKRFVEPPQR